MKFISIIGEEKAVLDHLKDHLKAAVERLADHLRVADQLEEVPDDLADRITDADADADAVGQRRRRHADATIVQHHRRRRRKGQKKTEDRKHRVAAFGPGRWAKTEKKEAKKPSKSS